MPMLPEAELARKWREKAWREGQRPALPQLPNEHGGGRKAVIDAELVAGMLRAGMSQGSIAAEIGCDKSRIAQIARALRREGEV